MDFEIVIGFEVHCELKTKSKVWCGCPVTFGSAPNTNVCPVCLGMPGSLPVLNKEAFKSSVKTAMALHCDLPEVASFDRKNYYYPDLPKNYQISQNDKFVGTGGYLEIQLSDGSFKKITMHNIHLEEDAGKNIHPEDKAVDYSLVDLNRAGTPLLEIVTNPDIRSKEEAEIFMQSMRSFLQYLDVSDCKMQEGSLRFELNMSLRPKGSEEYGQKVEVKNLNSIATVLKCIEHEYYRQSDMITEGKRIASETRLWDDVKSETRAMRTKEEANDYRYFPDPDLVEIDVTANLLEEIKRELPELPLIRRQRFIDEYKLPEYDATVLTQHIHTADYFELAVKVHNNPKGISNWIMTEGLGWVNKQGEDTTIKEFPVTSESIAKLVGLIDDKKITGKIAKQVFPIMLETGESPEVIVEEKGLKPIDSSSLDPIIEEVIAANEKIADDIRNGKLKAVGALMGQVMKKTQGKADPSEVRPAILKKLGVE